MSSEMKKVILPFVLLLCFLVPVAPCFAQKPGFTQQDRKRLIRLEATLTGGHIYHPYCCSYRACLRGQKAADVLRSFGLL